MNKYKHHCDAGNGVPAHSHALALLLALLAVCCPVLRAETLYNGVVLPSPWPPRAAAFSVDPVRPPYLRNPPDVIPIDVGRQLFVDDFLIEKTDLVRRFHSTESSPRNPILRPDKQWE